MSDVVQPVVGYRAWYGGHPLADPRLAGDFTLWPLVRRRGGPWLPGVTTSDRTPSATNTNGLYSFYAIEWLLEWLEHPRVACPIDAEARLVAGITLSWGATAPGHQLLAAEHAQIIALLDGDAMTLDPRPFADAYGVPVLDMTRAESWAAEFGTRMPMQLRESVQGCSPDRQPLS